jgi:hypothetical protein
VKDRGLQPEEGEYKITNLVRNRARLNKQQNLLRNRARLKKQEVS